MLSRTFNSVMHYANSKWAAEVLDMKVNPQKGPDIISGIKQIELKFNLQYEGRYNHKSWRVLDHQLNYHQNDKFSFWGLGFYHLDKPISQLRSKHVQILEGHVKKRELYIVDWSWMNQFPLTRQQGKTEKSQWDNTLCFPKFALLPETIKSFEVKKGLIHITEGVPVDLFIPNSDYIKMFS